MLLQKQYEKDPKTQAPQRVSHVLVKHTGLKPEQNFSRRLVESALADGWMTLDGATLTMKGDPEDLVYLVKRDPGYYCVSTGERIPISQMAWTRMLATGIGDLSAREAKGWLLARGKAQNDYEVCQAYECVLDADQHDRFKLGA